jgi:hypothetical protein
MKTTKIFAQVDSDLHEFEAPFRVDSKLVESDFPEISRLDLIRVRNTFNTIQYKILIVEKRSGRIVSSSSTIWDAYHKARFQFKMAKKAGYINVVQTAIAENGGKMYDDSVFELL